MLPPVPSTVLSGIGKRLSAIDPEKTIFIGQLRLKSKQKIGSISSEGNRHGVPLLSPGHLHLQKTATSVPPRLKCFFRILHRPGPFLDEGAPPAGCKDKVVLRFHGVYRISFHKICQEWFPEHLQRSVFIHPERQGSLASCCVRHPNTSYRPSFA